MDGMNLRLTEEQINQIIQCALGHYGQACELRVFGSRTKPSTKGGDIDLHIKCVRSTVAQEMCFLSDIQAILGEKVDLRVQTDGCLLIDQVASNEGVLLYAQ